MNWSIGLSYSHCEQSSPEINISNETFWCFIFYFIWPEAFLLILSFIFCSSSSHKNVIFFTEIFWRLQRKKHQRELWHKLHLFVYIQTNQTIFSVIESVKFHFFLPPVKEVVSLQGRAIKEIISPFSLKQRNTFSVCERREVFIRVRRLCTKRGTHKRL